MKRFLTIMTLVAAAFYLAACAALYAFQGSLLYYPQPRADVPGTRLIKINSGDAEVNVTAREQPGTHAVLYFGGNAEDVSRSASKLMQAFPDQAIYAMHYRGYGGSAGVPSEISLVRDAVFLFDQISQRHSAITVVGRSLGSGVATQLASQRKATRLVLITPYDSIQNIAAGQFPFFPISLLLNDKFESWKYASQISVPTLIIAAENDTIIPMPSTLALLNRFPKATTEFKLLPGTGHNTLSAHADYLALLRGSDAPPVPTTP